jgi:hypothetical protein
MTGLSCDPSVEEMDSDVQTMVPIAKIAWNPSALCGFVWVVHIVDKLICLPFTKFTQKHQKSCIKNIL